MSHISQEFITNKIADVKHQKSNESVLKFISKIVINNDSVVFGIRADKADLQSFEKMKKNCEDILREIPNVRISLYSEDEKVVKNAPVKGVKKVIVVASGKGGVGKSTVAFNLSIALAEQGKKVGIVDVDIYGPSLPKLSGISQKPVIEENMVIPHSKFGVKMMSVGFLVEKDAPLVWRGPMTSKMLYQLIRMTNWGELDYLIVDTPPGTGDVHLSLAENYKIDGAIVVTTPQELALIDAAKGIEMFKKLNIPVIGIVENMSYYEDDSGKKHFIFGKDGAEKLASKFRIEVLAKFPIYPELTKASDNGAPITVMDNTHPISKLYDELCLKINS